MGLPEGSRLSPIVAELLLAPVVRALMATRRGRVVTYADNFLLSATSEARLHWLVQSLRDELSRHLAGPLTVRDQFHTRNPHDEFEFLGYLLTPNSDDIRVTWAPKHERHAREMRRQAYKQLNSTMPRQRKLEALSSIEREHTAFTRSFIAWPERMAFNEVKLAGLRALLFPVNGPDGTKRPSRMRCSIKDSGEDQQRRVHKASQLRH